jgi:uncharacterized membrane protein (UPF0182 family)
MAKGADVVRDPSGQQRVSGQATTRQSVAVIAIAAGVAAFGTAFLRLDIMSGAVVVCLVTIVLGLVGNMIVRRFNRRRR